MLRIVVPSIILSLKAVTSEQNGEHPNLLLILTDQQRFDALGRAQTDLEVPSKGQVRTPHMDRLAHEGAYFQNAYTHCAICVPARTSLLTGRTIENTGVRTNEPLELPGTDVARKIPNLRTYDQILVEDFGYSAEYYGKWHAPYSLGYVYQNDVRAAGTSMAWFGRYDASGNGTKLEILGMAPDYRRWLEEERNIPIPERLDVGQQRNPLSRRAYVPDPLDAFYGIDSESNVIGIDSNAHGLDLVGDGNSITAYQGSQVLEALGRLGSSGNPFTLHISFHMPHPPWIATERYYNMFDVEGMELPASLWDEMNNSDYASRRMNRDSKYFEPLNLKRWKATYYGNIAEVDEWVGALVEKLDELGITNNTLVAFSSDHGEMMGAHGMKSKGAFYDESSRIPLVLRFPGQINPGTVVTEPVTLLDLHATFLDYLKVEKGDSVGKEDYKSDGISLRKYVEGTDFDDPFCVTMWNSTALSKGWKISRAPAFMVRKGRWKMMVPNAAAPRTLEMLFDLVDDPHEINNLIGRKGMTAKKDVIGKAEHLNLLLDQFLVRTGHPAADIQRLRKKGWRSLNFWLSDSTISFRTVLSDGSRKEWLYLGCAVDGGGVEVTNIAIEGPYAERFQIDWTNGKIAGNEHRRIGITYTEPPKDVCASLLAPPLATLLIQHDSNGGGEERVALAGPCAHGDLERLTEAPMKQYPNEISEEPTIDHPLFVSKDGFPTGMPALNLFDKQMFSFQPSRTESKVGADSSAASEVKSAIVSMIMLLIRIGKSFPFSILSKFHIQLV